MILQNVLYIEYMENIISKMYIKNNIYVFDRKSMKKQEKC